MTGFKTLEKKYGITVTDDSYYNPLTGRLVKQYNIYDAEGCSWAKGLTREGVKKECEYWHDALLKSKKNVNNGKGLYEVCYQTWRGEYGGSMKIRARDWQEALKTADRQIDYEMVVFRINHIDPATGNVDRTWTEDLYGY